MVSELVKINEIRERRVTPFVRKKRNVVKCGHREEALTNEEEITEAVAISQMECIDGQTASSFLLFTFLLRKERVPLVKTKR